MCARAFKLQGCASGWVGNGRSHVWSGNAHIVHTHVRPDRMTQTRSGPLQLPMDSVNYGSVRHDIQYVPHPIPYATAKVLDYTVSYRRRPTQCCGAERPTFVWSVSPGPGDRRALDFAFYTGLTTSVPHPFRWNMMHLFLS